MPILNDMGFPQPHFFSQCLVTNNSFDEHFFVATRRVVHKINDYYLSSYTNNNHRKSIQLTRDRTATNKSLLTHFARYF